MVQFIFVLHPSLLYLLKLLVCRPLVAQLHHTNKVKHVENKRLLRHSIFLLYFVRIWSQNSQTLVLTEKKEGCCSKMRGNDATALLLWFSMYGSSDNCFLHNKVWSEMQRTLMPPSSYSCVAP